MASEVKIVVKAVDQASGVLKGIAGGMAGVAAAAAGLAVGFAGAAFAAGNELNKAFNDIIIGTGATGDALMGLKDDFREVFRDIPASAKDVSTVLAELNTRLDITGEALQGAGKAVLDFSRVTGVDASRAARMTGQLVNALGLEAGDTTLLLDKLTKAGQMSGISVDRLGQLILDAGPSFESLGFDLDRSIALFASFEKAGARPEEVIASMTKALNTIAKEGFKNAEEGFNEYLNRIKEAPDILAATTIANELFGQRVGAKVAEDIRAGRFEVEEWTTAIAESGGTLEAVAQATLTWSDKLDILKNRATLALEPIGSYLVDAASALMDEALPAFDKFVEVVNVLWGELVTMWNESERVAQVMEILQDIFNDIAAQVIPFLLEQFEKLNAWYIENEELINDFKDTMIAAFEALKPVISDVVGIILTLLDGLIDYVLGMVKTIMQIATGDWAGAWETYKETAANAFDSIGKAVEQFVDMVAGWFGSSAEEIKEVWSNNFKMLGEITEKVMQIISKEVTSKLDTAKGAFSGIISKIKDLIKFFKDLAAAAANFKLPPLLTPGSPTPFEMGLRGINDAMKEINQKSLPAFTGGFGGMNMASEFPAPAMATAGMGGGASISIVYAPQMSFGTAAEFEQNITPLVEKATRKLQGFN